ncbi:hypothetical protein [Bacillus phage FI_KG-Lek]|nr:hypothetical protein [Bacillus phage FI_KG-Lek]
MYKLLILISSISTTPFLFSFPKLTIDLSQQDLSPLLHNSFATLAKMIVSLVNH